MSSDSPAEYYTERANLKAVIQRGLDLYVEKTVSGRVIDQGTVILSLHTVLRGVRDRDRDWEDEWEEAGGPQLLEDVWGDNVRGLTKKRLTACMEAIVLLIDRAGLGLVAQGINPIEAETQNLREDLLAKAFPRTQSGAEVHDMPEYGLEDLEDLEGLETPLVAA